MLNTRLLTRPFSYDRPRIKGYEPLIKGKITRITMQCQQSELCDQSANELIVNTKNLSQYRWLCPKHRNAWLYKPGWYRASESVKQVVLMNEAKERIR